MKTQKIHKLDYILPHREYKKTRCGLYDPFRDTSLKMQHARKHVTCKNCLKLKK